MAARSVELDAVETHLLQVSCTVDPILDILLDLLGSHRHVLRVVHVVFGVMRLRRREIGIVAGDLHAHEAIVLVHFLDKRCPVFDILFAADGFFHAGMIWRGVARLNPNHAHAALSHILVVCDTRLRNFCIVAEERFGTSGAFRNAVRGREPADGERLEQGRVVGGIRRVAIVLCV